MSVLFFYFFNKYLQSYCFVLGIVPGNGDSKQQRDKPHTVSHSLWG